MIETILNSPVLIWRAVLLLAAALLIGVGMFRLIRYRDGLEYPVAATALIVVSMGLR